MKKITLMLLTLALFSLGYSQTMVRDYTFPDASSVTATPLQVLATSPTPVLNAVERIASANNGSPETDFIYSADGNGTGALKIVGVNPSTTVGQNYLYRIKDATINFQNAPSFTLSFDIKSDGPIVDSNIGLQVFYPRDGGGLGDVLFNGLQAGDNAITTTYQTLSFEITPGDFNGSGNELWIDFGIQPGINEGNGGSQGTLLIDNITVTVPDPTCSDGIENGDETGVDCGGSCAPCEVFSVEGDWEMDPVNGSYTVSQFEGATGQIYFASGAGDVTQRACFFDDLFVFGADLSFNNDHGAQTWLEGWQGPEGCGAPVAPHDNSNAATYVYDNSAQTLTLNGVGAYIGLPKAVNGGELPAAAVPASRTYKVAELTASKMILDIEVGGAWWRFKLRKYVAPTCDDGIQNGDEDGVDCGGTAGCPDCPQDPAPATAAPTPNPMPGMVTNKFSDTYGPNTAEGVAGTNWGTVEDLDLNTLVGGSGRFAGEDWVKYYTNLNTQFISWPTAGVDTQVNSFFHIDVWSDAATSIIVKLEAAGGPFFTLKSFPLVPGQWNTLVLNLNDANDQNTMQSPTEGLPDGRANVFQLVLEPGLGNNFYLDNIYFAAASTLSDDNFEERQFSVSPNPTKNSWNIKGLNTTINSIEVFDILGKRVQTLTPYQTDATIDGSNLKTGIYLAKINSDNGTKTIKLVKN